MIVNHIYNAAAVSLGWMRVSSRARRHLFTIVMALVWPLSRLSASPENTTLDRRFAYKLFVKISDNARKDAGIDARFESLNAIYAAHGFRKDRVYVGAALIHRLAPLPSTTNRMFNEVSVALMKTGVVEKVVLECAVAAEFGSHELSEPRDPSASPTVAELRGFRTVKKRALVREFDYSRAHAPNRLLVCISEEAVWRHGSLGAKDKLASRHASMGARVISEALMGGALLQVVEVDFTIYPIDTAIKNYLSDDVVDYAEPNWRIAIE